MKKRSTPSAAAHDLELMQLLHGMKRRDRSRYFRRCGEGFDMLDTMRFRFEPDR
jgi:hypothetical protein